MMANKINSHLKMKKILSELDSDNKKKILLHTCCGPCFTIPFEYLKDYFEITLFFNNSNIFPKEEYLRRLEELKRYIQTLPYKIDLIVLDYDYEDFIKDFKGHECEKEGTTRCFICYEKRIRQAFEYASENGFDYVGSVMSISRYKNAAKLNEIGNALAKEYKNVKWLEADFKKENGYENSLKIIEKFGMYKQDYCGCEFSYNGKHK